LHGCELLDSAYINNTTKLKYKCECGNISYIRFSGFQNGERCNECVFERRKTSLLSFDYVYKYFEENSCKLLTKKYFGNTQVLEYLCEYGHKTTTIFNSFQLGRRCINCYKEKNRGENHPRWNSNKTDEERARGRTFFEYNTWRKEVFDRDNYTCQCCGDSTSGNLNAHHLNSWDWCVESRLDINNGITLCNICHVDFHGIYGYGDNTIGQWREYLRNLLKDSPKYNLT
jgi:5-methylcytosine-specific restriction endonuclease McrA